MFVPACLRPPRSLRDSRPLHDGRSNPKRCKRRFMRQHALRPAGEGEQQQAAQELAQASGSANDSKALSAAEQQQQQPGRGPKLAAAAISLGAVGAATFTALSSQPQLPPVAEVLGPLAAVALGGPALVLLAAKAVLGDLFHVELHRGRVYVTVGVPSQGPAVAAGAVVVKPTGDVRGNGAFAAQPIPRGTYLGDYTGELLGKQAFFERYPLGIGDYAAAVDDEWTIDAVVPVADTANFHPVHMNHSRGRANVKRYYNRGQRSISFFTIRDVLPGEELLYDYGWRYWRGREDEELP